MASTFYETEISSGEVARTPKETLGNRVVLFPTHILQFKEAFFSILVFTCKLAPVASFLNVEFKNEATRAKLQENKRTLTWRPFWNKVYKSNPTILPQSGFLISFVGLRN